MKQSTRPPGLRFFSARAPLVALGLWLQHKRLLAPLKEQVRIPQKTVRYTPVQKLADAFVAILAGARGLVEVNKRVRADRALQIAFGRTGCAEQSVIQQTLDACTQENLTQMQQAMDQIYQQHSRACGHPYATHWQVLDVDMSGAPCGKKCEFATKGYFAHQPNRRGRQLGRVLATGYQEIVVDQLFDGKTQLARAFVPLMQASERRLGLSAAQRERVIVRMDAGGGSLEDINWALSRGYQYHGKDYSPQRAQALAASVTHWIDDPKVAGRQVGWVECPTHPYVRPVRRIAVRCPKPKGGFGVGVIVSTLDPKDVILLSGQPIDRVNDPNAVLLAYVYFYDQRGGGIETSFKQDKQGLGLTKRNKKRFLAQQMLVQLAALAHNVIVWAREWLAPPCPRIARWGVGRLVRDLFHTNGTVLLNSDGNIIAITLNPDDPVACQIRKPLKTLLKPLRVSVILG